VTELIPSGGWFEEALAERDPAVAARIVGEPGRLLAASVNPEVAVAVLRALAALAWRTDEVSSILARVARWPDVAPVKRALERVQLDIAAGHEYRVAYSPVLPPYMHELVALAPFVERERRAELGAALRAELVSDPGGYLALLDTLNVRCYPLATALTLRILDDVAWPRRELGALLPELRVQLDVALDRLRGGFLSMLVTTGAVGAGIAGFAAGVAIEPGLGVAAGGGAALMVSSLRGRVYLRFVRVPLAGVLATCGVTRACARERMQQRGGRLNRFAGVAGDDNPLRLFGMIAAAAMTMEEGGTGPAWQPAW
jgi:hypothetical protein